MSVIFDVLDATSAAQALAIERSVRFDGKQDLAGAALVWRFGSLNDRATGRLE
jgi:hypothetical protein